MRTIDVAVVGAGPAGIGAALAAARNGASVLLIDENAAPGGHLRWTMARQSGFDVELEGLRGYEIANWAASALASAGVEVLPRTVAWGLFEENVLGIASEAESFQLRAEKVVIATGATDIAIPFPGWELPGVLTATAVLRLMHLDRVLPGQRVAVLGEGLLSDTVADDVAACGAEVVFRTTSCDDLSVGGSRAVEWVGNGGTRIDCDAVVIAFGRQPDSQLVLQAQVALEFGDASGVYLPSLTEALATSNPTVYVAGDAAGVRSAARSFAEGQIAGEAATGSAGLSSAIERLRTIPDDFAPSMPPELPQFADETLICRCEEVSSRVVREAIAGGAISINDLKRRTRAGMGICQGVFCNRTTARMIASQAVIPLDTIVPMTARPPARLISMAALADLDS